MGIKLDWEVESEDGWSEVGEDAKLLAKRRLHARRIRAILLSALGVALAAGAMIGYRLYRVGQEVRAALESTLAAETLALRIGDRQAFLSLQSEVGNWQEIQAKTFDQYQSEGARVQASGQIVEMEISADRARVVLREALDGVDYHVLWFYQRDEKGWKHIPPAASFWGEQQQKGSAHFDFTYYEEDEALVEALIPRMNSWWETACRLTECTGGPVRVQVRVEPDPLATVDWAAYNASTLIIPSPLLGRVRADGSLDPALVGRLADLIAGRWAEYTLDRPACQQDDAACPYSDLAWLEEEMRLWLRQSFDGGGPGAPLVGPLAETYGQAVVLQLMEKVKAGEEVGPALKELTGVEPIDLPVGWELYLTYRLRGEMALMVAGYKTEAGLIYSDPERPYPNWRSTTQPPPLMNADLGSIEVVGWHRFGDLLWAETQFKYGASDTTTGETPVWVCYEPFRLVSDRWVHTVPRGATERGALIEERGDHVTLRYNELDALFLEGFLSVFEQARSQISSDLGIPQPDLDVWVNLEGYTTGSEVAVSSPHASVRLADQSPEEYVRAASLHMLILDAVESLVTPFEGHPEWRPLLLAVIRWEEARLNLEPTAYPLGAAAGDAALDTSHGPGLHRTPPESLDSLWPPNSDFFTYGQWWPDSNVRRYIYATRDYIAADVLINLLAEKYGPQAIAPLLQNLTSSTSMDDWLSRSLGIHSSDIEAEWHTRTAVAVSALP